MKSLGLLEQHFTSRIKTVITLKTVSSETILTLKQK